MAIGDRLSAVDIVDLRASFVHWKDRILRSCLHEAREELVQLCHCQVFNFRLYYAVSFLKIDIRVRIGLVDLIDNFVESILACEIRPLDLERIVFKLFLN